LFTTQIKPPIPDYLFKFTAQIKKNSQILTKNPSIRNFQNSTKMLNSLIIAQQQQQSQQQQQQQHVAVAAAGTLEQLIRAAKLMEQRAVANNLLLAAGPMAASTSPSQIQLAK
jgi:hypothetical protein